MASMSNYLENQLVDHLFRGRSFSAVTDIYVALFTAAPNDAGGGTEVSGGSYARVLYSAGYANWEGTNGETTDVDSAGTTGQTTNISDIEFPAPTGDWGQVTHWALFDAATDGNLLIHAALAAPKTVNNGDPAPKFEAGSMTVTLA